MIDASSEMHKSTIVKEKLAEFAALAATITETESKIVVYGIGNIGKQVVRELRDNGIPVKAILDGNTDLHGTFQDGIPICSLDSVRPKNDIIIVASHIYYMEIAATLSVHGARKVVPYCFVDICGNMDGEDVKDKARKYIQRGIEYAMENRKDRLFFNTVDVVITEKCSFRCQDCSNLMQYYVHPKNADLTRMKTALDQFFRTADRVIEMHILGGEPFINPQIGEHIKLLQRYSEQFDVAVIYTNATILPSRDILQTIHAENVVVNITDYGHPHQRVAEFIERARKEGITTFSHVVSEWQDCGHLQNYARSLEDRKNLFAECCVRDYYTIKDGKLFRCPFAANAATLEAIPANMNEFVILDDQRMCDSSVKDEVRALMEKDSLWACMYCGGRPTGRTSIPAAIQISAPKPYERFPAKPGTIWH